VSAAQSGIIAALWLTWLAIWVIAAARAKPTARQESGLSRLGHVLPLIGAGLLLGAPVTHAGVLGARFVPQGVAVFVAGVALLALGLGFAVWARVYLGGNWSSVVAIKQDHALITSGPYRVVRHPIYTGLLAAFLGHAIALGEWRGLLAVLLACAALWRKAQREERWLVAAFGAEYAAYQATVAALIPFVL
jgi:protein-S-isoprenylcysteine O-methyltransferase Ste14